MTELEYIENAMRLRQHKELSAVRCENALMHYYGATIPIKFNSVRGGKPLTQRVYECHNGHPMRLDEVAVKLPGVPRDRLRTARTELVERGILRRVAKGVCEKAIRFQKT